MKFLFIALMLLLMLPACATKPKKLKPWPWDFAWLMDAMFYNQQDYDPPPAEARRIAEAEAKRKKEALTTP